MISLFAEGTESSHQHEPWDEDYTRGYEWFMMKEAKKVKEFSIYNPRGTIQKISFIR